MYNESRPNLFKVFLQEDADQLPPVGRIIPPLGFEISSIKGKIGGIFQQNVSEALRKGRKQLMLTFTASEQIKYQTKHKRLQFFLFARSDSRSKGPEFFHRPLIRSHGDREQKLRSSPSVCTVSTQSTLCLHSQLDYKHTNN